jgi:hypothetical protein
MKHLCTLIFPLILIFATLGCDYGPMPDENGDASMESLEEWEEFSDLDGELKFNAKKKENKLKKAAFSVEDSDGLDQFKPSFKAVKRIDNIDSIAVKPVEPSADCKCDCTMHAAACIAAGCAAQSQAVDNAGTCIQNGSNCNGSCKCHDCYTPIGKMCHSFPTPKVGVCKWHF